MAQPVTETFEAELSRNPDDEATILAFAKRYGQAKASKFAQMALPRLDGGSPTFQRKYADWLLARMVAKGKLCDCHNGLDGRYRVFKYTLPGAPCHFKR